MWIIGRISEKSRCMHTFQGEQPQLYAQAFGVTGRGEVPWRFSGNDSSCCRQIRSTDKQA